MNQDPNNLNQNDFNTQGNDGIPNNQPSKNNQSLNNTFGQNINVNQSTFNNQQQVNVNQQPVNQINEQFPKTQPMNSLENGNASQSFNNKPPKKRNLGLIIGSISAVVVVSVIATVIFSKFMTHNDNKNNSVNSSTNIEDSKRNTWLDTVKKSELKEPTYLYSSEFSLPITLKNVEEVEKSFKFWIDGLPTSDRYGINITDISTITKDTTKFNSEVHVTTTETNIHLPDLYSVNYSGGYISVADSFANNWWHLEEYTSDNGNNPSKIFGLDEYEVWDEDTKTSPVLNEIINKIGSPTSALFRFGSADGDGYAYYYLAWEFEKYTIAIHVSETRNFSQNTYAIYQLGGVQYYTPESWDNMKNSEEILSIYKF